MEKNQETLSILRHSTSHVMAQAVQKLFPNAKLAIGPATDDGFYYDFDMTDGHTFTHEDFEHIEAEMKNIIKQNLTFEKVFVEDVDKQIEEFKSQGEIYKAELLEEHRNDNPTLYLTKDKDGNVITTLNTFLGGSIEPMQENLIKTTTKDDLTKAYSVEYKESGM